MFCFPMIKCEDLGSKKFTELKIYIIKYSRYQSKLLYSLQNSNLKMTYLGLFKNLKTASKDTAELITLQ